MSDDGEVKQIAGPRPPRGEGKRRLGNLAYLDSMVEKYGSPAKGLFEEASMIIPADWPPNMQIEAAKIRSRAREVLMPYIYAKKASVNDDGSSPEAVTIIIAGQDRGIL